MRGLLLVVMMSAAGLCLAADSFQIQSAPTQHILPSEYFGYTVTVVNATADVATGVTVNVEQAAGAADLYFVYADLGGGIVTNSSFGLYQVYVGDLEPGAEYRLIIYSVMYGSDDERTRQVHIDANGYLDGVSQTAETTATLELAGPVLTGSSSVYYAPYEPGHHCHFAVWNVAVTNIGGATASNLEISVSGPPSIVIATTSTGSVTRPSAAQAIAHIDRLASLESAYLHLVRRFGEQDPSIPHTVAASSDNGEPWSTDDEYSDRFAAADMLGSDPDCDCIADPLVYRTSTGAWQGFGSARAAIGFTNGFSFADAVPLGGPFEEGAYYEYNFAVAWPRYGFLFVHSSQWSAISVGVKNGLFSVGAYAPTGVHPSVYSPPSGVWRTIRGGSFSDRILPSGPFVQAPGNFDNDEWSDLALYNYVSCYWFIDSGLGNIRVQQFGFPGCLPVPGDYDGDGRSDIAVYYPPTGNWYLMQSRDGFTVQNWGWSEAYPVQNDYDGDNRTDLAVFNPATGAWYIRQSSNGQLRYLVLGGRGNEPVHTGYRALKQARLIP